MHKFFIPKSNFQGNVAYIEGDDVKHIYKVLRLDVKDRVNLNNCEGEEYIAKIKDINKQQVVLDIIDKVDVNNESAIKITLFQGLPKAAKMDLIVQKSTELGINTITPVITERVIVKGEVGEFSKIDRLSRIALEACKQCKRSIIPKVNKPIDFDELLNEVDKYDLIVVPYENQENYGIKKMLMERTNTIESIAIIVGPEGGFAVEEIEKLKEKGAEIVTLGPRILRTETAGFVCASILMYEIGDLGGIV